MIDNSTKYHISTDTPLECMQCYAQPSIQLFNCDNLELMAKMGDESVDVILTDPPYLYLKNQKLEREFDEKLFFSECKRILTEDGFIVLFGRGTSFYRWNTILADLGFEFKEEIVWDKAHNTSPLLPISRIHETASIHTNGTNKINKVKVPYLEMKGHDIPSIIQDMKRVRTVLKNTKSLNAVLDFLKNNQVSASEHSYNSKSFSKGLTRPKMLQSSDRAACVMNNLKNGMNEKSIIRTDRYVYKNNSVVGLKDITNPDRAVSVVQSIDNGMTEKTIIKEVRDHYSAIHPTQKPVRLLERLLALVIPCDKNKEDIIVFDPFGGSFSTMEAVHNMQMKGISCEIDEEYFLKGKERIEKLPPRQTALFD
jgi:site-specific DNA-methyltransferase (adenine-specific)